MTILTNDVTTRVWWTGEPVQDLLNAEDPPETAAVGKLLKVWLEYRSKVFRTRVTGTCPHDPLTVAEAAGGEFVRYARGRMSINEDASTTFIPDNEGPHLAGVDVDEERFLAWLSERLLSGRVS
jgi:inosine-uridine nucleoside N-ribohydrolase